MSDLALQRVLLPREIADGFGRGVLHYEKEAEVQRFAAAELASYVKGMVDDIPPGPLLEVGCGTGFVSRHLSRIFPEREMEITDLSPEMLAYCRALLADHRGGVTFREVDAEGIDSSRKYSLITAGFVAQWFREPAKGLIHLASLLLPGGGLIASLPGRGSFPEWREGCVRAGVEYPGLELPEAATLTAEITQHGWDVNVLTSSYTERYATPLHFFSHIRKMGAAPPIREDRVSPARMRAVLRELEVTEGMTPVTYEVIYLFLRSSPGSRKVGTSPSDTSERPQL